MEEPAVFKGASCLRVCGRCALPKLVLVVVGLAIEPRHQARPCGRVMAGEGEPSFGGAFVGREFGVRPGLFIGESPPNNKANAADCQSKASVRVGVAC